MTSFRHLFIFLYFDHRLIKGFIKHFEKVCFHSLLPPEAERSTAAHLFYKMLGKAPVGCIVYVQFSYCVRWYFMRACIWSTEMICARKLCVHQTEAFGDISITMNHWRYVQTNLNTDIHIKLHALQRSTATVALFCNVYICQHTHSPLCLKV